MSNTANTLFSLIRSAQNQLGYMRANRRRFVNPGKWVGTRQQQARLTVREHGRFSPGDVALSRLAARWAVADARRQDNPRLAERLDREVVERGVSRSELESARWRGYEDGWQDSRHRLEDRYVEPGTSAALGAGVSVAAGVALTAALWDNAATWDEATPDALDAQDAAWADPVSPTEQAEAGTSPEVAALPAGLFPYSIETQMAHVIENGGTTPTDSPTPVLSTAPEVSPGPSIN